MSLAHVLQDGSGSMNLDEFETTLKVLNIGIASALVPFPPFPAGTQMQRAPELQQAVLRL